MDRQSVSSSSIATVGYNPETETLEIEFLGSGRVYEYYNVPVFMFERIMEAPSVGIFFNAEIRNDYAFAAL